MLNVALYILSSSLWIVVNSSKGQILKTLNLGLDGTCEQIRNGEMEEGDSYVITYDPSAQSPRQLPQCTMKLDYGDRKIIATVETMDCGTPQEDGKRSLTLESPILALYDNCDGTREDLLAWTNCTTYRKKSYHTQSTCIVIYHSLGDVENYSFSLKLTASKQVLALAAWSIAAMITCSIVLLMFLIKCACVVTGYERRLPELNISEEQQKAILEEAMLYSRMKRVLEERQDRSHEDNESLLTTDRPAEGTSAKVSPMEELRRESSLRGVDHRDLLHMAYLTPHRTSSTKLKRYHSFRSGSIFRK